MGNPGITTRRRTRDRRPDLDAPLAGQPHRRVHQLASLVSALPQNHPGICLGRASGLFRPSQAITAVIG